MTTHLLICEPGDEVFLAAEIQRGFKESTPTVLGPGLVQASLSLDATKPPRFAFARQLMAHATPKNAGSISGWSHCLLEHVSEQLPAGKPWRLHIVPHYGAAGAGLNRCEFIRESLTDLLRKKHRQRLRTLETQTQPFSADCSLVQLLLTAPDQGFISIASAPQPRIFRSIMSPFPKGEVPVASDKAAPSRAFAKLVEAEQRLGLQIKPGETVVDLGASPGSWSYVAIERGARVTAVDRSPLRDDLMRNPRLSFHQGDAFKFVPEAPVDWLICDVIAAPERSMELVLDWVRARRCRRFVVTIKFKGTEEYPKLDQLKSDLPPLCDELFLARLCANKNEACVFGVIASGPKT